MASLPLEASLLVSAGVAQAKETNEREITRHFNYNYFIYLLYLFIYLLLSC